MGAERSRLSLPADIRTILEETYRDASGEPAAWQSLRKRLLMARETMAKSALRQSNPWQLPLDDDEGVRTRWNSCPTVNLFMVHRVVGWDEKEGAELELLNGECCRLGFGHFNVSIARSLHRNLVRVPRWAVAERLSRQRLPQWLRPYMKREGLLVKMEDDGTVAGTDGEPTGLQYRPDLGIVIPEKSLRCKNQNEEDDESYDW